MRGSVAGVPLAACCRRSLRQICEELEKNGIPHALLSSGALQPILNVSPAESTISVSAADWDVLADEVATLNEGAKDTISSLASTEMIRHADEVGMFWRSLNDCFV